MFRLISILALVSMFVVGCVTGRPESNDKLDEANDLLQDGWSGIILVEADQDDGNPQVRRFPRVIFFVVKDRKMVLDIKQAERGGGFCDSPMRVETPMLLVNHEHIVGLVEIFISSLPEVMLTLPDVPLFPGKRYTTGRKSSYLCVEGTDICGNFFEFDWRKLVKTASTP